MDMERIVDKIKKCLALSESSNENEAKLAAERAAELMEKYKLSMAELRGDDVKPIEIIEHDLFRSQPVWHTYLARHVAYATDCKLFTRDRGKLMIIVGTATNLEMADYLYTYLQRMLRHLARIYCLEFHGTKNPGAHVRYSFLEGCCEGVGERLRAKKDAVRAEARASGTSCTALMVIDKEASALDAYMAALGLGRGRQRRGHGDGAAYHHGCEAGRMVQIRDAVHGRSGSTKLLGR